LTEWDCGQARHASLHSHTWPIHFAHPITQTVDPDPSQQISLRLLL
jgi:hypothetical protein